MENKDRQIKKQKERKIAKNIYILIMVIVLAAAAFFVSVGRSVDDKNNIPEKYQELNSNSISE